jgi:hypothetical protein
MKLTIKPIGRHHPRSNSLPHVDTGPTVSFFLKGYLLVRQFVHEAGCIQLFLVPIVKNIHFLLVLCATDLVLWGPLKRLWEQWKYTVQTKKHCCRWFQGTLKVEYALSFYGYTFCIAGEDLVACSFRRPSPPCLERILEVIFCQCVTHCLLFGLDLISGIKLASFQLQFHSPLYEDPS